jgi:pyruvate dehydrogenase E2 component (dihydrolipoamide acetyltransferase)
MSAMPTPVVMPQMGESIAEGTVVRWMKKVGDVVERDEPLLEISTDKVDAEIPSPASGVLTEIRVKEGETAAVNEVVGTIGEAGEVVNGAASAGAPTPAAPAHPGAATEEAVAAVQEQANPEVGPVEADRLTRAPAQPPRADASQAAPVPSKDALRRQKSSPLVRRIARDHNVDISTIHGSGIGGRVTKHDILAFLETRQVAPPAGAVASEPPPTPTSQPSERVEIQPLSIMRKKIAEHMILSRRTSAHVHSVFHVDFSTVDRIRREKQAEYERLGTKLTYLAFIAKATVDALRRHPIINASLEGDNVVYKKDINLGIAVALDEGLIVPVIKNADEKNLLGLCRAIADVAARARARQLKPDEVHGGTFTITNPGQFGSQFGLPIIHQPQVAILGVGTIEKRPVIVDDAIAIRMMGYLTIGFDHRLIDGAVADQFMADIKHRLEHFDPAIAM